MTTYTWTDNMMKSGTECEVDKVADNLMYLKDAVDNFSNTIPTANCSTAQYDATLTGTVTATNGSTTVTGTGTLFTTELTVGDTIVINGTPCYISAITSNTSLTLNQAYANVTGSYTAYKANKIKIVNLEGFELVDGIEIDIKSSYANMAFSPFLNVNNTGAIRIVQQDGGGNADTFDTYPHFYPAYFPIRYKYYANWDGNPAWVHDRKLLKRFTSGKSWVEQWSDGWFEQGGSLDNSTNGEKVLTFILPFKNSNYTIIKNIGVKTTTTTAAYFVSFYEMTPTTAKTYVNTDQTYSRWLACGY